MGKIALCKKVPLNVFHITPRDVEMEIEFNEVTTVSGIDTLLLPH